MQWSQFFLFDARLDDGSEYNKSLFSSSSLPITKKTKKKIKNHVVYQITYTLCTIGLLNCRSEYSIFHAVIMFSALWLRFFRLHFGWDAAIWGTFINNQNRIVFFCCIQQIRCIDWMQAKNWKMMVMVNNNWNVFILLRDLGCLHGVMKCWCAVHHLRHKPRWFFLFILTQTPAEVFYQQKFNFDRWTLERIDIACDLFGNWVDSLLASGHHLFCLFLTWST